jgi:hypothetical protein
VGSVAVDEALAPPPDAAAVFVSEAAAFVATFTISAIGGALAAAAIALALVHVTIWLAAEHVQPVPLAALKVSPAGSVSVTAIVPALGAPPVLLTTSAYDPVWPATNEPACDFASASTGLPESVVGSTAIGVLTAPPPLTVTEFVTAPAGPTALTVSAMVLAFAPAAILVALVHVTV